jgi:hypothetical protein
MSMQQETDVHAHLSNQPSIVGSKHDSAVQCANPQCSKELLYLREGRLNLLEMEPHSDDQFQSDVGAFAMRSVPSKCFWLCGECTKTLIVKRWTTAGIVLVLRNQRTAGSSPNLAAPPATSATTAATSGATDGSAHAAEGAPAPSAPLCLCCGEIFLAQGRLTSKIFYDGRASIQALSSLRIVAVCFAFLTRIKGARPS